MTPQEFKVWKTENTGIIYEQVSEEDVVEYGLRIKAREPFEEYGRISNCKFIYFPLVGNDESCLITLGHHTIMDGMSALKTDYLFSEQAPEGTKYNPFTAFLRTYSWPQWIMMLITAPYAIKVAINHIYSRTRDINCIKSSDIYCQGVLLTKVGPRLSLAKLKETGKKFGVTLNEVIMGIISKSFKRYFQAFND